MLLCRPKLPPLRAMRGGCCGCEDVFPMVLLPYLGENACEVDGGPQMFTGLDEYIIVRALERSRMAERLTRQKRS